MSLLQEMARQHADDVDHDRAVPAAAPDSAAAPVDLVPIADLAGATGDDPPQVPVFVAWARVMRDVEGVAKSSLFKQTSQSGKETRYNFRGVDAMINAFGPACRAHGVMVIPHRVDPAHASATSNRGSSMRETTTVVTWRIYGPMGDWIEGQSEGESLDISDKGTAKAQSVALRAFLIAAGLVPTDERDPDAVQHERGERPTVQPTVYRDEIVDPRTSAGRLRQIRAEVNRHGVGNAVVTNEHGDEETLLKMIVRIGTERAAAESAPAGPADEWPAAVQPPVDPQGVEQ